MEETWKEVPEFPHYQASSLGRIKSLPRVVRGNKGFRTVRERIIKPIAQCGYLYVNLSDCGKRKQFGVHQVVARAFFGLPSEGQVVDHLNCDKLDNRPENLQYVTNSENVHRQYRNGLLCNKGETHGGSKLSNAQVYEIRLLQGLETPDFLAERYGVCVGHIKNILAGRVRKDG